MGFLPGIVFPHRGHASVDLAELDTSEQQSARVAVECEANFKAIKETVNLLQQKVDKAKSSEKLIPELKELKAKIHQIHEFIYFAKEASALMEKMLAHDSLSSKNYVEIISRFSELNQKSIKLSLEDFAWEIVSDHELINISNDLIRALIQYLNNSLKEMEKKLPKDPLVSLKNFILAYSDSQGVSQLPEEFFQVEDVVALAQVLKDPANETKLKDLVRDLKELQNFHSGQEDKFVESFKDFLIKIHRVIYGDGYVSPLSEAANFQAFKKDCLEDLTQHGFEAFTEKLTNEITSLFIRSATFTTSAMLIDPSQFLWIPGDQEEKVLAQFDKVLERREFFIFL